MNRYTLKGQGGVESLGDDKNQNENVNIEFMKYPHYRVPNEIHNIGLRMAEIAVYGVLCRYCNPGTTAWPSYSSIAERAGCSKPTAIKAVRRLIKIGLLKKTRRRIDTDRMNSNQYEVNHDIQGQYLKLAPNKTDRSPDNLNSGKRALLPLVKQLYRGGKRDCPDKELSIKNYSYKELIIGGVSEKHPPITYYKFKKQNPVDKDTDNAITYYLDMYSATTGRDHLKLKRETWQGVVDTLLVVDLEHGSDWIDCDDDNGSIYQMIDHYFNKDYNDGDCNRCITHFNHPGIKRLNFYESAY